MQEYSFSNKEHLLEALSSSDFSNRKNFSLYQNELDGVKNGENSPDFLEILPWNRIGKIAEVLNFLLSNNIDENSEDIQSSSLSRYNKYCHDRISKFTDDISLLLNSVDSKSQTKSLLLASRKILGLPRNNTDMIKVINSLSLASKSGSLPDNDLLLIQYPGAFLPFPHTAHLELVQKAYEDLSPLTVSDTRIVVNTFEKNSYRNDEVPVFKKRVKNLQMGFGLQDFVTVLGISGDSDRQYKQMKVVSRFSPDKTINYLCGSDTIIKKVDLALNGDTRARNFFDSSTHFWVSLRPSENMESLNLAIELAHKMEGSKITILPSVRNVNISGTQIREGIKQGSDISDDFTNIFIDEMFLNQR